MKNWFKFLGITALAAVIGFALAGCELDAEEDDGSYTFEFQVYNGYSGRTVREVKFINGNTSSAGVLFTAKPDLSYGAYSVIYKVPGFTVAHDGSRRYFGVKVTLDNNQTFSDYSYGGHGSKVEARVFSSKVDLYEGSW
jgi:hypothetical protein